MLLLMASLGMALAAEDDLARSILDIRESAGAPVLICVAGQDADKATQRALRDRDDPGLRITRIPMMGDADAEVARALADSGLRCAVRVAPEDGGFAVTRHGDCSAVDHLGMLVSSSDPPTAVAVPGADSSTAGDAPPEEAAQFDALTGAAAKGDPPPDPDGGTDSAAPPPEDPAEPVVVTATEWAQREQLYNQQRLQILDLAPDPRRLSGVEWELVDGRATPMAAPELAELANNDDLRLRLERERKGAKRATRAMFWTGIGVAALSPLPLFGVESGAIPANRDRAWTSIFLLASGGLTVSLSTGPRRFVAERQHHASLYVEPMTAEDVAIAHNQRLWQALDLDHRPAPEPSATDAGPQTVVIGGGSTAPEEPEEPDGPDGPALDAGAPTVEGDEAPASEGDTSKSHDTPATETSETSETPEPVAVEAPLPAASPPSSIEAAAPTTDDVGTAGEGGAQ